MLDTMVDFIRDLLLVKQWTNIYLYVFCLGTALKVPRSIHSWLHHLVLTLITGFAGGFFTPLFMGGKPNLFANEYIIPFTMINWYLAHYTPLGKYIKSRYSMLIITIIYEIFRAKGMCDAVDKADEAYGGEGKFLYAKRPLLAPILIGTLGSCLGFFLPFSKGLDAIKNGMPQPMQVPFIGAIFYHLTKNDTGIFSGLLRGIPTAIGLTSLGFDFKDGDKADEENIRIVIVLFFQFMALWTFFKGADSNPLTALHTLFYKVTFVPPIESSLSYSKFNPSIATTTKPQPKTSPTTTTSKKTKTPTVSKREETTKKESKKNV